MVKLLPYTGFDWDEYNQSKIVNKHGITKAAIEYSILHAWEIFKDIPHSITEERIVAIGNDPKDRTIFSVFTYRIIANHRHIRVISSRYVHEKEIKTYQSL